MEFGYQSTSLLWNLGNILFYEFGIFTLAITILLLKILRRKCKIKKSKIFNFVDRYLKVNFFLRFFLETYFEILIATFINLTNLQYNDFSQIFSTSLTFIDSIICFSLPVLILGLVIKFFKDKRKIIVYVKSYPCVFLEVKNHYKMTTHFSFIFLFRRLIYGLTIVFMNSL